MQDKKIVALIILTVLAVISLIYGATAVPKGRVKSAAITEGQVAIASPQVAVAAKNVLSTERRARRSQFKTWKRSPFVDSQAASATSELTLNGIIWNKNKPKAMIGDAMVVKGDTVGANKVVDIQPNKVILNDGTKDFELKIEK